MTEQRLVDPESAGASSRPAFSRTGIIAERLAAAEGLAYEIPRVADRFPYFLGSLTLFGILIQVVTGIYLSQFYNPSSDAAHQSIQYIILRAPLGEFLRSVHRWSANFVLTAVTGHLLWVFWRGSYRKPRELTWYAGVLMLGCLFLLYFTGTLLPNDQEGYEALAHYIAGARGAGGFGAIFTPEFTPSVDVIPRLYAFHISILPILLFGFLGLHVYLIRFLDIHTHPGEPAGGSSFLVHLRKMVAHGLLLFALAGVFSVLWPAGLGYPAVEGAEVTKPPFFFLWIYALENWFGAPALVFGPPLVYLMFFLPPLADRSRSALPRDRKGILLVGYSFIFLLFVLAVYAWLAPKQEHLM